MLEDSVVAFAVGYSLTMDEVRQARANQTGLIIPIVWSKDGREGGFDLRLSEISSIESWYGDRVGTFVGTCTSFQLISICETEKNTLGAMDCLLFDTASCKVTLMRDGKIHLQVTFTLKGLLVAQ